MIDGEVENASVSPYKLLQSSPKRARHAPPSHRAFLAISVGHRLGNCAGAAARRRAASRPGVLRAKRELSDRRSLDCPRALPALPRGVDNVDPDGAASITYVFGPLGSSARVPGGTLHGIGVIRDGELRFQNSDGTQFAFRPGIVDLVGRMTTPNGQSHEAAFKKTL